MNVLMVNFVELLLFVHAAAMMSAIYEENKDEDGFLYMTYSGENTFGLVFWSNPWQANHIWIENPKMTNVKKMLNCKLSCLMVLL